MGVIIGFLAKGKTVQEPFVNLETEVFKYIYSLKSYCRLNIISNLNPHGVTILKSEELSILFTEVEEILDAIKTSKLLAFSPPDCIGEESGDIEEFGWRGLIDVLVRLRDIVSDSINSKHKLIVIGD